MKLVCVIQIRWTFEVDIAWFKSYLTKIMHDVENFIEYTELPCWATCYIAVKLGPVSAALPPYAEWTRSSATGSNPHCACSVPLVTQLFTESGNTLWNDFLTMQILDWTRCYLKSTTSIMAINSRNFPHNSSIYRESMENYISCRTSWFKDSLWGI